MKVFGYIRVSGKSQVEGDGPDRQRDAISNFCRDNQLPHAQDFFEAGVSGTKDSADRPAFRQFLTGAAAGDAVVVERMDRLARDLMVQELLLKECSIRHLKVYCADQGLVDVASNDIDPTRKLIRQVLGAVAEWEKSAMVAKLMTAKMRLGKMGGVHPYGTQPGEEEILESMFSYWRLGLGWTEIAHHLMMAGHRRRKGGPWTGRGVRRILQKNMRENK
jgi:DNA invertase Pin-like site-specific DNA recombinase